MTLNRLQFLSQNKKKKRLEVIAEHKERAQTTHRISCPQTVQKSVDKPRPLTGASNKLRTGRPLRFRGHHLSKKQWAGALICSRLTLAEEERLDQPSGTLRCVVNNQLHHQLPVFQHLHLHQGGCSGHSRGRALRRTWRSPRIFSKTARAGEGLARSDSIRRPCLPS